MTPKNTNQEICQTIINEETGEICGHDWEEHYHRFPYSRNGKLYAGKCKTYDCPCKKFTPKLNVPKNIYKEPAQSPKKHKHHFVLSSDNSGDSFCEYCGKTRDTIHSQDKIKRNATQKKVINSSELSPDARKGCSTIIYYFDHLPVKCGEMGFGGFIKLCPDCQKLQSSPTSTRNLK
jgi:hypothetical protein